MTTWNGTLAVTGSTVTGELSDRWGWTMAIAGVRDGANRMILRAELRQRGDEAPPWTPGREVHTRLAVKDAILRGEMVRNGYVWTGGLEGVLRIFSAVPWSGEGPIALRGEPPQ